MNRNIFDLTDLSDLPAEFQAALTKERGRKSKYRAILDEAPDEFTVRQFRAGVYRRLRLEMTDSQARSVLYDYQKRGLITKSEEVSTFRKNTADEMEAA